MPLAANGTQSLSLDSAALGWDARHLRCFPISNVVRRKLIPWSEVKWSAGYCQCAFFLHCHQPPDTLHVFVLVTFGANTSRVGCSISSAYRKQRHGKMSALQSLWIKLVGEWCKRNDVLFHPVNCMMLACLPLLQSSSFLVYQDNNNSGLPLEGRIQPQQW